MWRHSASLRFRAFAWVLVLLFLHTQSVMGVAMRTSVYSPDNAGMQVPMANGVDAKMTHAMAADDNANSGGAPCPMKSRMQNSYTFGCSGCAPCCSAVSVLDWSPSTTTREDILAYSESTPAACASFPPFHPPKRV